MFLVGLLQEIGAESEASCSRSRGFSRGQVVVGCHVGWLHAIAVYNDFVKRKHLCGQCRI